MTAQDNFQKELEKAGGIERIVEMLQKFAQDENTFKIDPSFVPSSKDLSGWEKLTDPRQHDNAQFRYLVHAVVSENNAVPSMQNQFILQEMQRDPTVQWDPIDLLMTPEKIAEKPVISASLIDAQHRGTWRAGGYILRVPTDNLLKTCSQDCGTFFHKGTETRERLYQKRDTEGIADPDLLLQYSSPDEYNEVVVAGTGRNGGKVEIAGVFVKVLPYGSFVVEELARTLQIIAYSRNFPVILIQEPFIPFQEGEPRAGSDWFNLVIGDRLYLFNGERSSFTLNEYGGKKSRPMTPDERKEMIGRVRQYLSSTPNMELEKLVSVAEGISDDALQQRVEEHYRWKIP